MQRPIRPGEENNVTVRKMSRRKHNPFITTMEDPLKSLMTMVDGRPVLTEETIRQNFERVLASVKDERVRQENMLRQNTENT
ncbi:hypothetical protein HYV73_03980 [Candidatus Uhrbacteria bacterium]|nr:hypothetical protein [Candidatus Uhrbacteria bacterium]